MVYNRYTLRREETFLLVELNDSFYLSKTFKIWAELLKMQTFSAIPNSFYE